MSKTALSKKTTPKSSDLSAQAHGQIMDFLQLAATSSNQAFVDATIKLAEQEQKQYHKKEAKLSPQAALTFCTLVAVSATGFSCFSLVHFPYPLNWGIVAITVPISFLVMGLCAMFSGHLSQANFMVVFKWVADHFKRLFSAGKGHSADLPISANSDDPEKD